METENFAFLPPITMMVFGAAFLFVWRYGSRPALWLAVGFAGHAAAFAGEFVLAPFSDALRTMVIDALFIASYFSFAQALAIHFGQPRQPAFHIVLCAAAYAVVAYAIFVADSLRLELLAVDVACALLLLLPLRAMRRLPARTTDRVFIVIAVVTALDFMARSVLFALMASPDVGFADYMSSGYAFATQISGAVLGLVFALAALGTVTLDVIDDYRKAAETDPLTELLNRRGFENAVCASEGGVPAGMVIVCDIDHFKRINDTFGHATGDRVIVALADILKRSLPEGAVAARFGGEEFVAFLRAGTEAEGVRFAQAVRRALEGRDFKVLGIRSPVTASLGVAAARPGELSVHGAVARADTLMYIAKAAGRNQVLAESDSRAPPLPAKGPLPASQPVSKAG